MVEWLSKQPSSQLVDRVVGWNPYVELFFFFFPFWFLFFSLSKTFPKLQTERYLVYIVDFLFCFFLFINWYLWIVLYCCRSFCLRCPGSFWVPPWKWTNARWGSICIIYYIQAELPRHCSEMNNGEMRFVCIIYYIQTELPRRCSEMDNSEMRFVCIIYYIQTELPRLCSEMNNSEISVSVYISKIFI